MKEYKIFNFKDEINDKVVFINSVEDLYYLADNIYFDISKSKGSNFSVLVDLFLRNGFSFNRYVLLEFQNKTYKSIIINPDDVSEKIKKTIMNYLNDNNELLDKSSLSRKIIEYIKNYK